MRANIKMINSIYIHTDLFGVLSFELERHQCSSAIVMLHLNMFEQWQALTYDNFSSSLPFHHMCCTEH